ncbi:hypothetical protein E6R18_25280 [Streptomyces sp. A1277]|uniref:hypothetical protein n=1 Tax=Streptomyces sp. A1277 TaxID=2563103 RepID=UPI0010A209CB|nr:hypothetical protein [Streptomyces sp. A1277]THA29221.1 hypothetical protein E6R18_25280 [Streptomyces sp. A1277]
MTQPTRMARLLDAVTHTGPGYNLTPATEHPMTERVSSDVVEARLHHLADRARRGALLPEEGALLADAVAELALYADQTADLLRVAHETSNKSEAERARAATRAEQAEAAIARVRKLAAVWDDAPDPLAQAMARDLRSTLDAVPVPGTVTITQARHQHLTAGQCIHHQEIHRLHHGEPVPGCPYPGCYDQPTT